MMSLDVAGETPGEVTRADTLSQLSELGSRIGSEPDPDKLLQLVTDEVTALVGAQFGAFFYNVVEATGESYMLYTLSGVERAAFENFPMPRNTAVFAPTFAGHGLVRSDDITRDPRYGKTGPHFGLPEGHLPVRSYLAAPVLAVSGEVLGGLFFGHPEAGRFSLAHEQALAALTPLVGVALTNARLFRDQRRAERELRQSQLRHQLVFEAMQEGMWYWNIGTNQVEWSDRLLELMGVARENWGGTFEAWYSRLHPEDQPRLAAALQAHLEERVPYRVERFRLLHADGSYRWCTTAGQAQWDDEGRPVCMAGSFRDINEQERARQAGELLAEASATFGASLDWQETLTNVARATVPRFADWTAVDLLEAGELRRLVVFHPDLERVDLAHQLHQKYPPDMAQPYGVPQVLRTLEPECAQVTDAMLVQGARDEEHLRTARALALHSYIVVPLVVQGEARGAITFVSAESKRSYGPPDVAFASELARRASMAIEHAQLYRQVRELAETLEQRVTDRTAELLEANRELEAFSYTVSHDLRAPLRHINGFADLLREHLGSELDPQAERYLATIQSSSVQMGALVDGLLAFSRLGRVALQPRPYELNSLAAEAIAALSPELGPPDEPKRRIEWSVGRLPCASVDPVLFRLVFDNLVGNAVKYTKRREVAHIELGSERRDGEYVVWVRDDGIGFDMEYSDKLFGVFQRLHSDRDFEGTGIGLATVRRIVQRHGGRTWAEARPGEGATLYFSLPDSASSDSALKQEAAHE